MLSCTQEPGEELNLYIYVCMYLFMYEWYMYVGVVFCMGYMFDDDFSS
jgi:hypothetical protein